MNESRPVWERALRISDEYSDDCLRRAIEPGIHEALQARGYSESSITSNRIPLYNQAVLASRAYASALESHLFDSLNLSTLTHVFDREPVLGSSEVTLYKIGGLVTGRLVSHGQMFFAGVTKTSEVQVGENPFITKPVSQDDFENIVEDVRAHTALGYSKSDRTPPYDKTVREIALLSPQLLIDRNLILSEDTHADHGVIEFRLGETAINKKKRGSNKRYSRLIGRVFEVSATQPLHEGSLESKISYTSKRGKPQMKLSVVINGTTYSEEEKQALYDDEVSRFQDLDPSRYLDAMKKNLSKVKDPDGPTVRIT